MVDRTLAIVVLTSILAFVIFVSPPLRAEEAAKPTESTEPSEPGSTDVELEEVEIRGEIERPSIFFILPKAQKEAETKRRRIRFYPDILEPIDKDRFEEKALILYQHGIPAE